MKNNTLTKEQISSKKDFIKNFIESSNAATASAVDSNANVSEKNIAILSAELYKDYSVQLSRSIIYDRLVSKYSSEDLAKQYIEDLDSHLIYSHDESHPFMPYCASVSLYPFLLNGLKGLGGESKAPTHLASYCGGFVNLVFALSSQFAGAIATVEFLNCFDYFARKNYGDNYLTTHRKEIDSELQHVVYALNQPAAARNYQSVFWNISIFDKFYFENIFNEFQFPDFTKSNWNTVSKLQEYFIDWFRRERHEKNAILTFPVITASMLTDDSGDIQDKQFLDVCATQFERGNSFFIYMSNSIDSLASCCRLRNELRDNTFSFSLGAGGVMTGSAKVITLNINKIVQTCGSKDINIIKDTIRNIVERVHKYLVAHMEYYQELESNNLFPAYSSGFISLKKQFLTIGINGVLESAEYMGLTIDNNAEYKKYLQEILTTIFNENIKGRQTYNVMFNTEFVPAENLGVKHAKWDKKAGLMVNRECYNSYMYRVEDDKINFVDKFVLHGKEIIKYLDGGSALHLNLSEFPSKENILNIFKVAGKTGCNYWTWNVPSTFCEDCLKVDKNTHSKCSSCGSENVSFLTRVIGYLKKIKDFSLGRQLEAGSRSYHKNI